MCIHDVFLPDDFFLFLWCATLPLDLDILPAGVEKHLMKFVLVNGAKPRGERI